MMFRVKYSIICVPWKGGPRQRCNHTIQTKGGIYPRSVQKYILRASDAVSEILADSNVLVIDEALKRV
jgi:hypothetical protein